MEEQPEPTMNEEVELPESAGPEAGAAPEHFQSGLSLGMSAKQDLNVSNSLVFGAAAGRDVNVSDGLSISTAVGRDLSLTDSLAVMTVAGKQVQISDGASIVTVCREVTAQNGTLGLVIARTAQIGEGSSVMVNVSTKQALLFGLAFGAVFALLSRLLRRR